MSSIFPYLPDPLAHLVGWNGGIVVGLLVGWWVRGFYLVITPTEHSQLHPIDGDAGGL